MINEAGAPSPLARLLSEATPGCGNGRRAPSPATVAPEIQFRSEWWHNKADEVREISSARHLLHAFETARSGICAGL